MGDAFDGIGLAMSPIVEGVEAPGVAGSGVGASVPQPVRETVSRQMIAQPSPRRPILAYMLLKDISFPFVSSSNVSFDLFESWQSA